MNIIQELRKIPFIRFLFPLVTGILIGANCKVSFSLLAPACLLLFISAIILVFNKSVKIYKRRWVFGFIIHLFFIAAGVLLMVLKSFEPERKLSGMNSPGFFTGRIISEPQQKNKTVKLILKTGGYKEYTGWRKCKAKLLLYIQKDMNSCNLAQGDIIILKALPTEIKEPANPYEFNYKRFLYYKGITRRCYIKSGAWKYLGHKNSLMNFSAQIRNYLLSLYRKYGFDIDELAVLSALTLGYRDDLSPDIIESFSSAGVMHILAVSGLHTGIVYYVLNIIFAFLVNIRYGKIVKLILVIIILWFYALLTGASIPVIRACVMFSLIQTGNYLGRMINIYNILFALAFFLLLFNPFQIFDAGFQLSFLAVLAIIFFQPRFYSLLIFKNRIIDRIWMLFTVSIAAQTGTFPVIIYYFHQFPVYFWIINILLFPPVALVIYLAILLFVFSPADQIANLIAGTLNLVLTLFNSIVNAVKKLPFSLIDNLYNSLAETILIYAVIFTASISIIIKNRTSFILCLLFVNSILSVNLYRKLSIYIQKEIIIFNMDYYTILNFIDGRNNYLVTDFNTGRNNDLLLNSVQNYWIRQGVNQSPVIINISDLPLNNKDSCIMHGFFYRDLSGNPLINFRGNKLLLLRDASLLEFKANNKFDLDYIIITNNLKAGIGKLYILFDFKKIIIDTSNNYRIRQYWKNECKSHGICPYIICEAGAFIAEI